jgi:hypothetical protein
MNVTDMPMERVVGCTLRMMSIRALVPPLNEKGGR